MFLLTAEDTTMTGNRVFYSGVDDLKLTALLEKESKTKVTTMKVN